MPLGSPVAVISHHKSSITRWMIRFGRTVHMLWYPTIFDAVTDAVTATISSLQYLFLYFSANYIGKLLNPASADGGRRPLFNDKLPAMCLLGFGHSPVHTVVVFMFNLKICSAFLTRFTLKVHVF